MNFENKLYEKTVIWNGDSICAGNIRTGNWAERIAKRNHQICKNYAVGGGTAADHLPPTQSGEKRHSVSGTLDRMYAEFPSADYIIFEGGTNDADLLGCALTEPEKTRLGAFDPWDFGGKYDTSTFCGGLESIFFRAIQYWAGKKICYIVAPKMACCPMETFMNRRRYFDEAVKICQKWGIPYLDLWNGCYLNPYIPGMHEAHRTGPENEVQTTGYYTDGQHLSAKGYDFTAEIIETWLKSL